MKYVLIYRKNKKYDGAYIKASLLTLTVLGYFVP